MKQKLVGICAVAAAAASLMFLTGCLLPIGVPPARVRLGIEAPRQAALDGDKPLLGSAQLGAHWASAAEAPFDLGIGFLDTPRRRGVYVEGAALFRIDDHQRWSINGAFEQWWEAEGPGGSGARLGLSADMLTCHLSGRGGGSSSNSVGWWGVYGFLGLGVYADVGFRHMYDGTDEFTLTSGLTFTLPLFGLIAGIK